MMENFENNNIPSDNFKWSPGDIRCLIHVYTENLPAFDRQAKKKVWNDIAETVSINRRKNVSGERCDGKFKGLKSMYKKIKDHNNTSGNSHKQWEYYDMMDELLNRRPEIVPPVTCASDESGIRLNRPVTESTTSTSGAENTFDFHDLIEETNVASPPSSLHRKRQAAQDLKNKNHEEKMLKMDKFLNLFEKLIDKI